MHVEINQMAELPWMGLSYGCQGLLIQLWLVVLVFAFDHKSVP